LSRLGICGGYPSNGIAAPAKQGTPHHWQFSKAHTGSRNEHGFPLAVILNHDNENARNIGQGEARHIKYKRLKLGEGQAYDGSSD
jgi:hypothetical protein